MIMAVTQIDGGYIGLSTDTKPVDNVRCGWVFIELDVGKKMWIFSKANVNPVTGDGWWEV